MRITNLLTDDALSSELGRRLERARLGRNLTQSDLAKAAGVSKRTVERLEAGASVQSVNLLRVLRVLNRVEAFDVVLPDTGATPLEQLQHKGKARVRASARRAKPKPAAWRWGDEQ